MSVELCDEEKLYHEWIRNNIHYISNNKQCIEVMKTLFMAGFGEGYMYKQKYNAEEQLQK